MVNSVYKLTADVSAVEGAIAEVDALLAESLQLPLDVVNRLVHFLDLGVEVASIEDRTADGTGEIRAKLKLPDGFIEAVATLRTLKRDPSILV